MCEWGTSTKLVVTIPAHLSHTGVERQDVKDVDSCIAPIVRALNDAGITTVASCCGHGKRPGNIALLDGREIVIAPDYGTGRRIDSIFPAINESDPAPASPAALGDQADELVDEVQHRMDQVVEAAVEWHQAGQEGGEWFEAAEKLGAAINSLLELRGNPSECFCGTELEAGLCPNGHDPISATTTPPSTLARKAAEAIIAAFPEIKEHDKWVTLGRVKIDIETETETFERATAPQLPVKDQIAAIIERCFSAESEKLESELDDSSAASWGYRKRPDGQWEIENERGVVIAVSPRELYAQQIIEEHNRQQTQADALGKP